MDWNQIQDLFDGQGIVFWAAVTAVTVGLTLLSVAIVFQVRKLVGGKALRANQPRSATTGSQRRTGDTAGAAAPQITVTENGYQADHFVPATGAANDPVPADPLLKNLLSRLRDSAARLDRIHASLEQRDGHHPSPAHSTLKATGSSVDYVYRTGRG